MINFFRRRNIPPEHLTTASSYTRLGIGFLFLTIPGLCILIWALVTTILHYRETGITSEKLSYACIGLFLALPGFAGARFFSRKLLKLEIRTVEPTIPGDQTILYRLRHISVFGHSISNPFRRRNIAPEN